MSINLTNIAWCTFTHNGYSGCVHAGPECAYCYAESFSEQKRGTPAFPHGFALTWRDNLAELLKVRGPALIFEGSMTDWFQETIPNARIDLLLDTCEQLQQVNPDVRILLLTKRTGRMARYSRRRPFPSNVWVGATLGFVNPRWPWDGLELDVDPIDARRFAYDRARQLQDVRGGEYRFLSCEPLLSPMPELHRVLDGISWVIVGGESGQHMWRPEIRHSRGLVEYHDKRWTLRHDRLPWILDIRDQVQAAGSTFFFKQGGGAQPDSAGHLLEGREYVAWPDGRDWRAVKQAIVDRKQAGRARRDGGYHV